MPLHVLPSKFEAPLLPGSRDWKLAGGSRIYGGIASSPEDRAKDTLAGESCEAVRDNGSPIIHTARQQVLLHKFANLFDAMSKADNPHETLLRWLRSCSTPPRLHAKALTPGRALEPVEWWDRIVDVVCSVPSVRQNKVSLEPFALHCELHPSLVIGIDRFEAFTPLLQAGPLVPALVDLLSSEVLDLSAKSPRQATSLQCGEARSGFSVKCRERGSAVDVSRTLFNSIKLPSTVFGTLDTLAHAQALYYSMYELDLRCIRDITEQPTASNS
eukprot:8360927-Pyramimonas_sp.AAC.1